MRNTRNWKNCTNWNKIKKKKMHYFYNFWYFFLHRHFHHKPWSLHFRAESLLWYSIITWLQSRYFLWSLPPWLRSHLLGGPLCLEQSPLCTAYTGLDTLICRAEPPHTMRALFSTHYYKQARSVIWIGALSWLCIWNEWGSFIIDMKSVHYTEI